LASSFASRDELRVRETIHVKLASRAANFKPDVLLAQDLAAPGRRAAMWLLWVAVYLALFAVMKFTLMSSPRVTATPLYMLQQGAALLTGILAARAALASVIPGARHRVWGPALVSGALWIAALLWEAALNVTAVGTTGAASENDWPCVASMIMGGMVLGGPLMWMLRRGAPLTPRATAVFAGLAALSIANVEACLTRPHVFATTVLLWHGTTVAIAAVACAVMGRTWLRWPDVRSRL
jgi:hypothetical protein